MTHIRCLIPLTALMTAVLLGFSGLAAAGGVIHVGPNLDISNEPGPQLWTAIAVNPSNPAQIVAASLDVSANQPLAPGNDVRAYFSSDGGATWDTSLVPVPPPLPTAFAGNYFDPGVAWDTQGNVFVSHGVWWGNPNQPFVIVTSSAQIDRSTDGGRTWTSTDLGFHPGNGCINGVDSFTIDTNPSSPYRDTIYATYEVVCLLPPGGQSDAVPAVVTLYLARSTDHGATFSDPVLPVGRTGVGVSRPFAVDPFVGPDGTVYVAYHDSVQGLIEVAASSDGGRTFGAPTSIGPAAFTIFEPIPAEPHLLFTPPGVGPPWGALVYPSCGADSSGGSHRGALYCAWIDETATNGTDVFFARSTDHGQTWSPRVRVNDDPQGVANDQFAQALSVDPTDGSVSMSWYDTRNDPTHLSTDVFCARSTDGGLTFSPNVQVTTASSNEACGTCGAAQFYGNWQGIAAYGGVVHAVWTDFRASVASLGEEVFTATITVSS